MVKDILRQTRERRERNAQRWQEHDQDLCMLCHAYGADKRSLCIDCFCDISEVLPEAIDLFLCGEHVKDRGFYLRICKACRGALLALLAKWREERIALRETPTSGRRICLACEYIFEGKKDQPCPECGSDKIMPVLHSPRRQIIRWLVQVKGDLSPGELYEISVVRKDNADGRYSWGWGGLDKIILFGTALGQNGLSITEENVDFALWIADTLCAALNEREET